MQEGSPGEHQSPENRHEKFVPISEFLELVSAKEDADWDRLKNIKRLMEDADIDNSPTED